MRIAVIGGGLAGLCAAHALQEERAGEIVLFERREGPGLETSFANGALLHPSAVDPWNSPGIGRVLLRSLADPGSAVRLHPAALPSLLGWGWRFLLESAPARWRESTAANVRLALASVQELARLRTAWQAAGVDTGPHHAGSLAVHREPRAFESACRWAAWLREQGVDVVPRSAAEAVSIEPALGPVATRLAGAIHSRTDEAGDAHHFCRTLAAGLVARGVHLRWSCEVRRIEADARGVRGIVLADGDSHRFDAVVLAAAIWSEDLARPLGLALPVRPAKGYSLTIPLPATAGPAEGVPRTPVIDNTLHIATTPLAGTRLRVAGTAEFRGRDLRLDPRRSAGLWRQLEALFPALAPRLDRAATRQWCGLRPLAADGRPLVGATRVPGLFLNTGHGQLGWTTGLASGRLLALALVGRSGEIDPAAFSPARFGL